MPAFVVDSAALSRNIEKLRRFTAAQIIAVVKGNGYGLGMVPYARFLTAQGVALLAVSTAAEAAALRDAGITEELLMLSSTALPEEIAALLARDVILTVGSADAARAVSDAAAARGVTARVHVKLDTGMGRYGFLPQETAEAAALLQALPALRVEGVFTHLSDAANAKCTALQYRRFTEGVRILQEAGIDTGLRHVCASTAFLRYPEMHLDAVRLGSALLGRLSVPDTLGLERIGWLEAQVTELKTLPAGWPVGYTGAYCTRRETRLALLPVGYTSGVGVTEETNALRLRDRLRRVLHAGRRLLRADGLTVLVNGCRCPVRGVVGATAIEADVTGVPCAVGDTARIEVRPKFVDSAVPREYR
ncbi:MAG: alanine racemase [Oscillospiraceae bacterium]